MKGTRAGFDVVGSSPEAFLTFVRGESDKLGKVIRDNNARSIEGRPPSPGDDATATLARFLVASCWEDVPAAVHREARRTLLTC